MAGVKCWSRIRVDPFEKVWPRGRLQDEPGVTAKVLFEVPAEGTAQ
jgi:hypothetical protein